VDLGVEWVLGGLGTVTTSERRERGGKTDPFLPGSNCESYPIVAFTAFLIVSMLVDGIWVTLNVRLRGCIVVNIVYSVE
jgi:hypothetical protein